MYDLVVLFSGTLLLAHCSAMYWIHLGLTYDDGWIRSLKAENADDVWAGYGPYELYVFSLYWIL